MKYISFYIWTYVHISGITIFDVSVTILDTDYEREN